MLEGNGIFLKGKSPFTKPNEVVFIYLITSLNKTDMKPESIGFVKKMSGIPEVVLLVMSARQKCLEME